MPERREQLMDAALAIVVRDGYDHLSVDAIAREAGVTRPVVYGAFDGLDALLSALLDREEARMLGDLMNSLPDLGSATSLEAYVTEAVNRLVAMFAANPDQWRPMLLTQAGAPAAVIHRIEADRSKVRDTIAGLISGYALMTGARSVDAPLVAHAAVALLEHFGRLMLTDPDQFTPERITAAVVQTIGLVLTT
ncbi:TetR/AcrR family transcriptional regulator [Nocardioides cavernaquae]|uniref:TetR/AcrR family transcriptional regulator n=2 Tax=Nocardioides cavernaquae TaxID=2321396 RepID=A0A3A5HEC5_9ACTN|nr:TetR/AcrR family transcriptional regulator [Nocardioides cavernaquae]